jgi:tRNA(His) 5'-end guanylyltransferase
MKQCAKCQNIKDENQFYQKTKNKLTSYCKSCFNQYCMQRWHNKRKKFILEKGGKCFDCGIVANENNLAIFDFHHRDSSSKEYDWNKLRLRNEKSIRAELIKCELLCSNCHRIKHWHARQDLNL